MYQPTTRLLTVLELLQARPAISGNELAARLEVDRRTVRRYVMMLQDMGIPVEAVRGRGGGYRLRPGFKLPPLLFTEEEALAVTLGLLAARQIGLPAPASALQGALAKLQRVLPTDVSERIKALEETLAFTSRGPAAFPPEPEALLSLGLAARQRRRVSLRYRDNRGNVSERRFDAFGLVFHFGRWYVAGLDHRSDELRIFRVDRVLSAAPLEESFERPGGFDAVEHVQRSLAELPWGWEIEVLLDVSPPLARSLVPAHVGTLEETPGGVLLRTQADDLGVAARHLAMLGCRFVIIKPPELRDEVRRLAEGLLELTAAERPRA